MSLFRKPRPSLALILSFVLSFPAICSAQWVKESYPLSAGWNAIWLSQDCSTNGDNSTRLIDDVLGGKPQILEVWRWNPLGSTVQFIRSPGAPIEQDTAWAVWRRGDPTNTTLGTLTGNSAYLVKVASTETAFTLDLTGKPLVPEYSFSSSGLNFLGFPTAAAAPKFDTFFSFSEALKSSPQIFQYVGGELSSSNPKNPQVIFATRSVPVTRGRAYWVKNASFSDFYGPLKVTVLGSGGVDFGRKLNSVTLRIKNVTDPVKNQVITANFALASSEVGPGDASIAPDVEMEVRGELGPNLQFTRKSLADSAITLAPGEEADLILMADRVSMNVADQSYASILSITDSLNHTRIDLPVSATGSSQHGVWMGAAILDSVNRVESISGPVVDAPVGTPDGSGPETRSLSRVTATTSAGVTTRTTSFVVDFDSEGNADLKTAGVNPANVSVTSDSDEDPTTPDFQEGVDYTLGASAFAVVTDPGSGYIEAPVITVSGQGGGEATATLSASVRRVTMTAGGSGYRNQPLEVILSGGGGSRAEGVITVDGGGVIGITMTEGGSNYTSAPNVEFPLPLNSGSPATGTAVIEGGVVTGINIDTAGSGYVSPLVVTFTGDGDSGASAFAVVSESGIVTDVFIENGGTGYRTPPTVVISGGEGSGAAAVAEISGGIGTVSITNGGAGYAQAPTLVFEARAVATDDGSVGEGPGSGAAATAIVSDDGSLTGVDRILKMDNATGPIGSRALVSLSSSIPAVAGTPNGTVVSDVISISKLVTLNGKSRLVTRRVTSGGDAAAPSNFPIRLILHAPRSGSPRLLQQVFLGDRDGIAYAGTSEAALAGIVTGPGDSPIGKLGRASSASFPLAENWASDSGSWGSSTSFTVLLGHNSANNPFVHSYHPDHDNWDARFEKVEPDKVESYTVERKITFVFSSTPPAGLNEPGWGVTTLGGTYTETFTGLRAQKISVSGAFILHQVSEAPTLLENP